MDFLIVLFCAIESFDSLETEISCEEEGKEKDFESRVKVL